MSSHQTLFECHKIVVTQTISTSSQQNGAVLFIAMMFLIVLTLLGISTIESTKYETRMTSNTVEYNQALQIAEVGLAIPRAYTTDDIVEMMDEKPKVGKASPSVLLRDSKKNIKYELDFITVFSATSADTTGSGEAGMDKSGKFVNFITISDGRSTTDENAPTVRLRGGMRILGASDPNKAESNIKPGDTTPPGLWKGADVDI